MTRPPPQPWAYAVGLAVVAAAFCTPVFVTVALSKLTEANQVWACVGIFASMYAAAWLGVWGKARRRREQEANPDIEHPTGWRRYS